MYTKIPYKQPKPIQTKVQAIHYIKNVSKRYAKYANDTSTVKYVMNMHKVYATIEVKLGIYKEDSSEYSNVLNIGNKLIDVDEYPKLLSGNAYGICDSIDNFLEIFDEELSSSEDKYFVCFVTVLKSEQPEYWGWRWHKWGPYIGAKQPTCEYLYAEPNINQVMLYNIYRIIPSTKDA